MQMGGRLKPAVNAFPEIREPSKSGRALSGRERKLWENIS